MTDTSTVGDVDIQVLEQLFEGFGEPCSFGPCENKADWMLLCPYDRNAESVCDAHKAVIDGWEPDTQIMFNETCGHNPDVGSCIWEPYN